jgi:4-oxalocrotonate tautomerase
MPFVSVRIVKGVLKEGAAEKKAEISRQIATTISEAAEISRDSVWVVFEDIPPAEWYVGEKNVEQMWEEAR